jgi:hypothetical protein
MINTLRRWVPLATTIFMAVTPAYSQAPTDAQRSAIRSACRADYEAHCASVPPGGEASLQCLQKNMSSLSSSCQTAVRAVEAPAASTPAAATTKPAAEPAAAAAPKAAAASTAAKKPSSAQIAAVRSACRSDYQKVCAGVPTGGAPALQCLEKNKSKVSPAASRRSTPPVAARQRLQQPALQRRLRPPLPAQLRQPRRLRQRWCCGRCGRARSCWSCDRHVAEMCARFARACRSAVAVSCAVWRPRPPRFRPRARKCWASSRRSKCAQAMPPATPREKRGSTEPAGPTTRCSRATWRSDTRYANPVLKACKDRRRNSGQEGRCRTARRGGQPGHDVSSRTER